MKARKGYKDLLAEANAEVETLAPATAADLLGRDDVAFIDLRDPRELDREGRMAGAVHCPRGMLEFWIEPESPYHKEILSSGKHFVFFCAGGWVGFSDPSAFYPRMSQSGVVESLPWRESFLELTVETKPGTTGNA